MHLPFHFLFTVVLIQNIHELKLQLTHYEYIKLSHNERKEQTNKHTHRSQLLKNTETLHFVYSDCRDNTSKRPRQLQYFIFTYTISSFSKYSNRFNVEVLELPRHSIVHQEA